MADKLKFSLCVTGHATVHKPEILIWHNDRHCAEFVLEHEQQWVDFEVDLQPNNDLCIDFHNKSQVDTVIEQNTIVDDMWVELHACRVDDILVQTWFLNDGAYWPRYFEDFIKSYPDSPQSIKSQRRWHFPGQYRIPSFPAEFWNWYHVQRKARIDLKNMDKDLHRWEKFVGSAERYPDIVDRIKKLIHDT